MKLTSSLVVGLAGALLLTACGSPGAAPSDGPTISAASAPAASPTSSAAPDASPQDDFWRLVSGARIKTYQMGMKLTTKVGGQQLLVELTGAVDAHDLAMPAAHLKLNSGGVPMEVITFDGQAYVKSSVLRGQWVKMSNLGAKSMTGATGPQMAQWGDKLKGQVDSIEAIGDESVGGVATKHYRLALKDGALQELGLDEAKVGKSKVVEDVWLDDQGRPRKLKVDVAGGNYPVTMTITIDDLDQPVKIAPPAHWIKMPA